MKKLSPVFGAFLAAVVGGFLVFALQNGFYATHQNVAEKPAQESTYDRVMRTQTIRCGYVVWTPFLVKDPNSGQLSGLFYDYTNALGQALHLKIDWTEEVGWGDFPAALNSGHIDAMCGGSWPNAARAREIDFVRPILFQPIYAYARTGDTRFDNKLAAINDPAVTIVVVEGSTPSVIAPHDFPKATLSQLPELSDLAEPFVNLVTSKADVAITTTEAAQQYDANNPGKIHPIAASFPLRVFGNGLAVAGGQDRFRGMLDVATDEMMASGQIDALIANYGRAGEAWLHPAVPYSNHAPTP